MKLVTTTSDLVPFFTDRSIAAPLEAMDATGFKHLDMSFYSVIYKNSPWISSGDGWKREVEKSLKIAEKRGFDFCQAHSPDGVHFQDGEAQGVFTSSIKARQNDLSFGRIVAAISTIPDESSFFTFFTPFSKIYCSPTGIYVIVTVHALTSNRKRSKMM